MNNNDFNNDLNINNSDIQTDTNNQPIQFGTIGTSSSEQKFYPNIDENGQLSFGRKEDHIYLKTFKEKYIYMLSAAVIYAILFTFSLYRNFSGIVTPIYPIASVALVLFTAKKVEVKIKRDTLFYILAIVLLGINLCLTKDVIVIFFDHLAILFLTTAMSLHIFYEDTKWGFGKYVSEILIHIISSIEYVFSIVEDGINYRNNHNTKEKNPLVGYIFIGVIVSIPLLIVVLCLLGSADYFFFKLLDDTILKPLQNLDFSNFDLLIMLAVGLVYSYGFVKKLTDQSVSLNIPVIIRKPAAIAVTINVILGFVYFVFSVLQVFNLFLGNAKLPDGYTYAEYAREGFFQLVVVCLINMVLVLIFLYFFENKPVLKITLTVICACTYLMIVSSAYRMYMYVNVYQLTYTRVFVFWALLVIFMIMNGITIYIYNREFNLFKYAMIMLTILYIGFAYIKPEALIAKNNLSEKFYNSSSCEKIDYRYLFRLSSDATPEMVKALIREDDELGMEKVLLTRWAENAIGNDELSIREFNFSTYFEYKALKQVY